MVNKYFTITLYIEVGEKKDWKSWGNNNDGDMVHKCQIAGCTEGTQASSRRVDF